MSQIPIAGMVAVLVAVAVGAACVAVDSKLVGLAMLDSVGLSVDVWLIVWASVLGVWLGNSTIVGNASSFAAVQPASTRRSISLSRAFISEISNGFCRIVKEP